MAFRQPDPSFFVPLDETKEFIVMGFMGSCPIAGVIWQHIHYIVGLQRLGHDVYYIEDSRGCLTTRETFEVNNEYSIMPRRFFSDSPREFGFEHRWSFLRALSARQTQPSACRSQKIRELYRDADAILNICGTQEFNDDLLTSDRILYVESDPGVEQIKVDQGHRSRPIEYLRRHHALFTFGENVGSPAFPGAHCMI